MVMGQRTDQKRTRTAHNDRPPAAVPDVGYRVHQLRTDLGWSQLTMIKKLKERAGFEMTRETLARVEVGRRDVSPDEWEALALALDVPPVALRLAADHDGPIIIGTKEFEPMQVIRWWLSLAPLHEQDEDAFADHRVDRQATAETVATPRSPLGDRFRSLAEQLDRADADGDAADRRSALVAALSAVSGALLADDLAGRRTPRRQVMASMTVTDDGGDDDGAR